MAVRIPWDKFETAILIEGCVDYNENKITKKEAVKRVSNELRQRALNKGEKIDDIYRNENGISMQFEIINSLIRKTDCGLHKASKLFREMSQVYLNDRSRFEKILKEAKCMEKNTEKMMQEQFSQWLSKQLSPAQMSEIYVTYYDLDKYLEKEQILSTPILETYDINKIKRIKEMIDKNGAFRYIHRAKVDKYSKAINLYLLWVDNECNALKKEEPMEVVDKSAEYSIDDNNDDKKVKYVDFEKNQNLAFTKVEYFEYFELREDNIGSWKQLYQRVLSSLYEDYPTKIEQLVGKCIGDGTRVDIDKTERIYNMIVPRKFANNLYVETNLNATNIIDKIRHLMDYCMIDYENLIVAYTSEKQVCLEENSNEKDRIEKLRDVTVSNSSSIEGQQEDITDLIVTERKKYSQWLNDKGLSQGIILVSLMDVSKMNKLLMGNNITIKDIYLIDNVSTLRMIYGRVQRTDAFLTLDKRLQKQYKNTFETYIEFKSLKNAINGNNDKEEPTKKCEKKHEQELTEIDVKILKILTEDFENGYRINSAIDKGRMKHFYSSRYNEELSLSDEKLLICLKRIGTIQDDRIFARRNEKQRDLLNDIYNNIKKVFNEGASCVYLEAVYQNYNTELADTLQIYDWEILGEQLIKLSRGEFRRKQSFLCLDNRQTNLEKDVITLLKASPVPVTYENLKEKMWYVPIDKIKHILVTTKDIVQVAPETYFYAYNFPVNQAEVTEIKMILHNALSVKTHITDVELRDMITEKCPSIAINTEEYTTYGFRNCLGRILSDSFSFNGPIISELGKEISTAEVYAEYCEERERITLDELKKISSDMNNSIIYWDSVREKTIRLSEDIFARNDQVSFDIVKTDLVLDMLCENDYIPLKDVGLFMHFPPIEVSWNGYVLESYAFRYSQKYRLVHASFSASGYFGAIVKKDSNIDDYQKLITDVLAHSNQWNDKKSALELLVDLGYQQRKKYANIEKVIHEARIVREQLTKNEKR